MSLPPVTTMLHRSKSQETHTLHINGKLKIRHSNNIGNAKSNGNPIRKRRSSIKRNSLRYNDKNNDLMPGLSKFKSTPHYGNINNKNNIKNNIRKSVRNPLPKPKPRHSFSLGMSNHPQNLLKNRHNNGNYSNKHSFMNKILQNNNSNNSNKSNNSINNNKLKRSKKVQSPLPRPHNGKSINNNSFHGYSRTTSIITDNIAYDDDEKNTLFDQMIALQATMKGLGDMVRQQDIELKNEKEINIKLKQQINTLVDENIEIRNKLNESRLQRNSVWQELEFYKLAAKSRKDKIIILTAQIQQIEQQKIELTTQTENLLTQLTLEQKKSRKLSKKIKKFTKMHLQSIKNRKQSISVEGSLKLSPLIFSNSVVSKRTRNSISFSQDISVSSLTNNSAFGSRIKSPSYLGDNSNNNNNDNNGNNGNHGKRPSVSYSNTTQSEQHFDGFDRYLDFDDNDMNYRRIELEKLQADTFDALAELELQTKKLLGDAEMLDQRTKKKVKKKLKKSGVPDEIRVKIKKNEGNRKVIENVDPDKKLVFKDPTMQIKITTDQDSPPLRPVNTNQLNSIHLLFNQPENLDDNKQEQKISNIETSKNIKDVSNNINNDNIGAININDNNVPSKVNHNNNNTSVSKHINTTHSNNVQETIRQRSNSASSEELDFEVSDHDEFTDDEESPAFLNNLSKKKSKRRLSVESNEDKTKLKQPHHSVLATINEVSEPNSNKSSKSNKSNKSTNDNNINIIQKESVSIDQKTSFDVDEFVHINDNNSDNNSNNSDIDKPDHGLQISRPNSHSNDDIDDNKTDSDDEEEKNQMAEQLEQQMNILKKNDAMAGSILDLFDMQMRLQEGISSDDDDDYDEYNNNKKRKSLEYNDNNNNNNDNNDDDYDDDNGLW